MNFIGVQDAFNQSNEYQLSDCASYFLSNARRISHSGYVPSTQDILHTRVRTCGVVEVKCGHLELLDGRLCMPDSEQRPLVRNFTTVAIVELCCHNFTQIANFMIFFVSTISYRPTDLSLLKEFSKNVSFWKFYIFH